MNNTILQNNTLFIRSQDSDNLLDNRSEFTITLQNSIKKKSNEIFKIIIQSVQIPYTFRNTNSNNNVLDWEENNVLKTPLVIKSGNYNILELTTEIQSLMNSNSTYGNDTYTLLYNQIENIVELKSTNANNTKLLFNSGNNKERSIASQLGFTKENDIIFNSNLVKVSDSYVNLITINSLFIRSNISGVNSYDSSTKQQSNILSVIPINTDPLGIITYQYYEGVPYTLYDNDNIQNLNFSLTNQQGNIIELGNQINWSFVMSIQIIKNTEYFIPDTINNNLENELVEEKIKKFKVPNQLDELIDVNEIKNKIKSHEEKHNENIDEIKNKINNI